MWPVRPRRGTGLLRGEVLRRAFEKLGPAQEQWIFAFFVAISVVVCVAVYRYMRDRMR